MTTTLYDSTMPHLFGSNVRQDFLIGNHLLRAVYGLTNSGEEIEFTVYLMRTLGLDEPDLLVEDAKKRSQKLYFIKDGRKISFPGQISSIRNVKTKAPAHEIAISVEADEIGSVELASWVAPDIQTIFIEVSAKQAGEVELHFDYAPEGSRLFGKDGRIISSDAALPTADGGKWEFAITWDKTPVWVEKADVIEQCKAIANRTSVSFDNGTLADRTNMLAPILGTCIRKDGRLAAGGHRAYDGAWIRDGVMDSISMLYAGCDDYAWDVLCYLLRNVPPKEGQVEENGMLAFGFYHYWLATGSDNLKSILPLLKPFVWDLFEARNIDESTGLLVSCTEGYWERFWLGKACEFSQSAWAVIAVRSYVELATGLGFEDDFATLSAKADDLLDRLSKFIVDGRFVKRLFPGGDVQWMGLVKRGLSLGGNTYRDQFAKATDYEEIEAELDPDVQTCVSWLWGLTPPNDAVCKNTAQEIWKLHNQDWNGGGLARYNVFSEADRETAGPWFLASTMAARAFALQDDWEKVSLIIDWTNREFIGSGWSERISRCHPDNDPERYVHEILNWPAGEWLMLVFREAAGLYPTERGLSITPHLPKEFSGLAITNFKYRGKLYDITYHGIGSKVERIDFDGEAVNGNILPARSGKVDVFLDGTAG